MARRRSKASRNLALAVAVHGVLALGIMVTGAARSCDMNYVPLCTLLDSTGGCPMTLPALANSGATPIDVTMIEPEVLVPGSTSPSPAALQQQIQQKVEEAKKPEEDPTAKGQVVETAKPSVEIHPDDAKYLSEYDSNPAKESKAPPGKTVGAPKQRVEAKPPTPTHPVADKPNPPPEPKGDKGLKQLAMRGSSGMGHGNGAGSGKLPGESTKGTTSGTSHSDEKGDGELRGGGGDSAAEGGGQGENGGGAQGETGSGTDRPLPTIAQLQPSEEEIQRAVGGGSSDYLKDVDDGEETLLKTKRWKYADFFNRVKRAVAQEWHPDTAYSLRDPTGQIYGQKNRLTVLRISLKPDGSIRDMQIEQPCGVDFLDDEAVNAFKSAAPFPNVPQGLVDKDSGLITFRFGFYFEVSATPTFRIFRYN